MGLRGSGFDAPSALGRSSVLLLVRVSVSAVLVTEESAARLVVDDCALFAVAVLVVVPAVADPVATLPGVADTGVEGVDRTCVSSVDGTGVFGAGVFGTGGFWIGVLGNGGGVSVG